MAFQHACPPLMSARLVGRSSRALCASSSLLGKSLAKRETAPAARVARVTEQQRGTPLRRCANGSLRMEVGEGDIALSFAELPTSGGGTLSAADLGRLYVIYFYPKDSTSGCTCEATDFTARLDDLAKLGAKVLGVSRDSVESHDKFVDEVGIGFPLLADVTGEVCDGYGVYKLRQMFGKEFMGIERSTFIVKDGKIVKAWRGVKAAGHADEVVAALEQLS